MQNATPALPASRAFPPLKDQAEIDLDEIRRQIRVSDQVRRP